jgi:hypothetical protein
MTVNEIVTNPMVMPVLIRHSLSAVGGALVATGITTSTDSQMLELIGAAMTIISFLWSLYSKRP